MKSFQEYKDSKDDNVFELTEGFWKSFLNPTRGNSVPGTDLGPVPNPVNPAPKQAWGSAPGVPSPSFLAPPKPPANRYAPIPGRTQGTINVGSTYQMLMKHIDAAKPEQQMRVLYRMHTDILQRINRLKSQDPNIEPIQ